MEASEARRFAKDCVRSSLLAPSTAKFFPLLNDGKDAIKSRVDGAWNVTGLVESQNGFGVPLQKNTLFFVTKKRVSGYVIEFNS
jgi:hypothetical protein